MKDVTSLLGGDRRCSSKYEAVQWRMISLCWSQCLSSLQHCDTIGWMTGWTPDLYNVYSSYPQRCVCVCVCVFVEEKFIVDGWDSSFTTDVTLLRHNSSMSTAELVTGFFQFYAQFDFRSFVLCPRLGHAIDVAEFIDRQQSDSRLQHFKVCLKPNWHEAVSVLQFLPCNAMRARYMLSSCVCLSVCLSLCHKSVFCEDC